ncbi:MAG: LVIVD repeat-containing protein [Candidatus Heimdallarchaeota archaeon]
MNTVRKILVILITILLFNSSFVRMTQISGMSALVVIENSAQLVVEDEQIFSYNLEEIGEFKGVTAAVSVAVKDNIAFIADQIQGLIAVDIADKTNISVLGTYQDADESVYDVLINGNHAFLAHGRAGFKIVDISDPANMVEVGAYDDGGNIWSLFIDNNIVYSVDRTSGIEILDISDLTNPVEISQYDGQPLDIFVVENYAYIAAGISGGLEIVKIKDIENPRKIAEIDEGIEDAVGIVVSGKYAYLATRDTGIKVIQISNPNRPKIVAQYKDLGPGRAWDVKLANGFLYIADEKDGVEILDISEPTNPKEIAQYIDNEIGLAFSLVLVDELIFVADFADGLEILTWRVAEPNPTPYDYVIVDRGSLNFNHSIGPFEINQFIGNESLGLNLSLFMDVGLTSPINITIEAPERVNAGEETNVKIKLTAEASTFWAAFRGSLSFVTPLGSSDLISLADAGIPEYLNLSAFKTFIGRNLTVNSNLDPVMLWEQTILNYTIAFVMTPMFNITGSATVSGNINNNEEILALDWFMDKEEVLVPITIPEDVKEFYSISLEDFQFNIDDLNLDFYSLKFALNALGVVELYSWSLNFSDLTLLGGLEGSSKNSNSGSVIFIPTAENDTTLLHLDGVYPLGSFIITLYFTGKVSLPPWAIVLSILGAILALITPWVLIFTQMRRKKPTQAEPTLTPETEEPVEVED